MDALLALAPAIQVNISAVAGYLMLAALSVGIVTMIGVLLSIKKQTGELWEAHLGARAIGVDGLPRWYVREAAFTEALDKVDDTIAANTAAVVAFTSVQRDLISELRLDRVERKAIAKASPNHGGE